MWCDPTGVLYLQAHYSMRIEVILMCEAYSMSIKNLEYELHFYE